MKNKPKPKKLPRGDERNPIAKVPHLIAEIRRRQDRLEAVADPSVPPRPGDGVMNFGADKQSAALSEITPPSAVALPERWARPTPKVDFRRLTRPKLDTDCGACGSAPEEHHGPTMRCPKPVDLERLAERTRRDKLSGRNQRNDETLRRQRDMQTFINQVALAQHATLRVLSMASELFEGAIERMDFYQIEAEFLAFFGSMTTLGSEGLAKAADAVRADVTERNRRYFAPAERRE